MISKSDKFRQEVDRKFRRVSFSELQRKLYAYDLSDPPKFLKKFLKLADVIIQPESKEEVFEILKLAKKYRKPVVPRGAATSAYGGAIPYKGGIVVDFSRMNHFEIDEDKKLLIGDAGVVWWDAQKELIKRGLSLRVYPTSALSSTIGGWIGQGGYGISSLKYGSIGDNVEWVEVADFNGISIRDPSKFVGLEGTTGLVVSAAIKLKEYSEDIVLAKEIDVEDALKIVLNTDAHTALFYSEKCVSYIKKVRNFQIERATLLLAFESGAKKIGNSLGEILWQERFYPFRVRKITNLLCVEVVLPIEKLVEFIRKIEDPYSILFTKKSAVVLIYLTVDEVNYAVWLKVMRLIKLAENHSGRIYSTGLWFSYKSDIVFPNFEVLRDYKKRVDKYNLLNPGKVFPTGLVPKVVRVAEKVVRE